jgi:nucleotide-binding universal stress UspA family protein
MTRILVAVNDSPAGLAAARAAIWLGTESGATVLAVHVLADESPQDGHSPPGGRDRPGPAGQADADIRARGATAVLDFVAGLAQHAGVPMETRMLPGGPGRVILEQAASWGADVIMLGRSGVRHVGQPFVGSQVLHVLEFADVPVVVVPAV